jgi:cytosine/adenosine deaminase-related metal-dependent hydrolase
MLEAGVPVALGTDSVVNLPEHEAHRITPLDDARLLFREQRADARTLLRMITSSPARMLGLDAGRFAWPRKLPCETTLAGVVLIDLDADNSAAASERDHASAVLASDAPPRLLWDGATWAGGLPASSGGAQA